jgi:hypothetical protein
MISLALMLFGGDTFSNTGMWAFLSIGAVSLFVIFIPTVTWIDKRSKEREAFYKAETLRRITEASGDGAKAALELMKEDSRMERIKKFEGLKLGGLICIGVGLAMSLLIWSQHEQGYLIGLFPGLIGVAILFYVYVLAGHYE